jgi:diaminopropionate ammonia-lyase
MGNPARWPLKEVTTSLTRADAQAEPKTNRIQSCNQNILAFWRLKSRQETRVTHLASSLSLIATGRWQFAFEPSLEDSMLLIENRHSVRDAYPEDLRSIMSVAAAQESRKWLRTWAGISPGATPLRSLPGLATALGVSEVLLKDESVRSDLGSFKALGAPIALVRLIMRLLPEKRLDPIALFAGEYKSVLRDFTVISATDGNHGKGLAAAARSIGCRCVIVLHANVSVEREQAIAAYGAKIVRIKGNYDESVAEAARLANENGWHVVSDTSYDGYEEVPRDVMQGYGTVAAEIVETCEWKTGTAAPFTQVFLQGGVGGLAAGIVSYLWEIYGVARPTFVVVEPEQADCLYQSAIEGRAAKATGSVDSVMAGLACGETSPLDWRDLCAVVRRRRRDPADHCGGSEASRRKHRSHSGASHVGVITDTPPARPWHRPRRWPVARR